MHPCSLSAKSYILAQLPPYDILLWPCAQNGGAAQYMRHSSGQFYGVSAPVAHYIKQNAPILHRYANEVTAQDTAA